MYGIATAAYGGLAMTLFVSLGFIPSLGHESCIVNPV